MMDNFNDHRGFFLDKRICDGPAAGLYTSKDNKELYDSVYGVVNSLEHGPDDYVATNETLILLMTDIKMVDVIFGL